MIKNETSADYIFYKIVHFIPKEAKYTIQCINTCAIFYASINDIVFDTDILYGLPPIQACYIGMEYAHSLKNTLHLVKNKEKIANENSFRRYGIHELSYQDRKGNICFKNNKTKSLHLMNPIDIALSKEIIQEFDASHAFYIGLNAGMKIQKSKKN